MGVLKNKKLKNKGKSIDFVRVKMSALNFLNKKFSNITLDNKANEKMNDKKMNDKKIKKENGEFIKFNHGVMIKLKSGIYKGYNGYVLEYYPDMIDVKFENMDGGFIIKRVEKKMVEIKGDNVFIKKGDYKGKNGELINIVKARLNVHIDALNKSVSRHLVKVNGVFEERNIEIGDVFYNDIMLKNGDIINVTKIKGEVMYGYDKKNNDVEVKGSEIGRYLPGFKINCSKKVDIEINDDIFVSENNVDEEEDHQYEEEEKEQEESEVVGYEVDGYKGESDNIGEEMELKVSFKDIERCEFVAQKLSKDETEIMNNVDKVIKLLSYPSDIINRYTVLGNIKQTIDVMKGDLERINITTWKESDLKYITFYLIIVELIKNRDMYMTNNIFISQVEKLYNVGYFTKVDIKGSCLLMSMKDRIMETCFGLIVLSEEKSEGIRLLYKKSKYLEIIIKMIENCGVILEEWYGKINLRGNKKVEVKIYNVAEGKREKAYPKYFLTTKDILTGNIPVTSKKIRWGPQSEYLVNIWKNGLNKKMEMCDNDNKRSVYEYVINNFDNAPFMKDYIPTNEMEKLKYTELMKTFVKFVDQLKEYVDMKNVEKANRLDEINKEKERVNKKRREICEIKGLLGDFEDIGIDENKKIKKYRKH
jgi:ribosomal protein L24